jgi:hypothetical protein
MRRQCLIFSLSFTLIHYRYMLTRSVLERMDEVERIIKVLLEKDDQAIKNIGDPSVFMGVFDAEAEEAVTAQVIESDTSAAKFAQQLDRNAASKDGEIDLFALFANPDPVTTAEAQGGSSNPPVQTGTLPTLFGSTFDYAIAALQALDTPIPNLTINEDDRFVELQLPAELERRYQRFAQGDSPPGENPTAPKRSPRGGDAVDGSRLPGGGQMARQAVPLGTAPVYGMAERSLPVSIWAAPGPGD